MHFLRWAWTHENDQVRRIVKAALWLAVAILAALVVTYAH